MRLIDLQIDGFGRLVNRTIRFDKDVNIIFGHNEAGKSTLHACIRAMFYGMQRARGVAAQTDTWSHFKPWDSEKYGAALRVEYNGHVYSIQRNFEKDPVGALILDETTMEAVAFPTEFLKKMLGELSAESYDNTISIGQLKSAADDAMAEEIKTYIINMDTTGNRALNCENAKDYLRNQKRAMSEEIVPDAARRFAANASEIKQLDAELGKPEYISKVREVEARLAEIKAAEKENDAKRQEISAGLAADKKELEENSFSNRAETDLALKTFTQASSDYYDYQKSHPIKLYRAGWITLLSITLIAGILFVFSKIFSNPLGLADGLLLTLAIVAGACLILGIILLVVTMNTVNTLGEKKNTLATLLREYNGSFDVTSENVKTADQKLRHLSAVALDAEERAAELAKLNEERIALSRRNEETSGVLSREQATQRKLTEMIIRRNTLRDENTGLREVIAHNDEINNNLEAVDIAIDTIEALSHELKNSFGVFLNKTASEYINEITGGIYDSMHIDDDLEVWMNTKDKMVPIRQVSGGTADQIYLALRLATAKLLQNGDEKLPLIFDDSFVNYDEDRLESVLNWITNCYHNQVLIFTCHSRESEILDAKDISYNKIELQA